ncbi:hypothetical protein BsWGS_04330 [Bradybaena similaris]
MIEVEDEPSESWADLTEDLYNDEEGEVFDDSDAQGQGSAPGVPAEVKSKCHDTARRYQGVSTSEFENEYPSLAESSRFRQKARDFDLRSRVNSRDSRDHHGDNGLWRRDRRRGGHRDNIPWSRDHSRESYDDSSPHSYRPRNPHRSDEMSPFRSPLNRAKRSGYRDLDNSNSDNFRFSNNRRMGGRSSGDNRVNDNERYFSARDENTKFSSNRGRGVRSSGGNRVNDNERHFSVRDENMKSCRRLYLPSQDDDLDDDFDEKETNEIFQVVTEEDKIRMARREKDIAYGKNTEDYKHYVQILPKYKRRERDPKTPDKYVNCSRRSWDGRVKHWKLKLHGWAANYTQKFSGGSQKISNSKGTSLTSECSTVKEEDTKLVVTEDSFEISDGGDGDPEVAGDKQEDENVEFVDEVAENENGDEAAKESNDDDDDDDFLGAIDYTSLIGKQES